MLYLFGITITFLFISPTPFFLYSFPPLLYLFLPSYLPSVFIQYFSTFLSLPLSLISLYCLSFLKAHSAPSFLSFHPIPVFSLLIPTSKSRHHFSFFSLPLPRYSGISSIMLTVVSGFFHSFPSFLLVCVFVPFTQFYTFIRLPWEQISIFPLLHWHTRFSYSISLSPSSPCFFSLQHSVSILHSSLALPCRSLPRFHSQPIPLTLFPHDVTWSCSVYS
jgi:hypothetical protein